MVLTKTTALFLFPSIAWILFARAGYRLRPFLRLGLPSLGLAAGLWVAYYGFIVRPNFLSDYKYFFSANSYTGINGENAFDVLHDTFVDGMWMRKIPFAISSIAVFVCALVIMRECFCLKREA